MKITIILILLSAVFFISCEKDFPGLIDSSVKQYQVTSVSPSGDITYNAIDSLITIRVNFTQNSSVGLIVCDIYSPDNKKLNSPSILLFDNGNPEFGDEIANDNRYANKFPLSSFDPIGTYSVRFYMQGQFGSYNLIAQSSFEYDNGQDNVAPVISDEIVDPDTVVVTGPTILFCTLKADDANGLNDIEIVYFIVYRPDGSTSGSQTQLFDDGNTVQSGDVLAGDGIFSRLIQVDQNNQKGTYRFEFRARDRGGLQSNTLNHQVVIQ